MVSSREPHKCNVAVLYMATTSTEKLEMVVSVLMDRVAPTTVVEFNHRPNCHRDNVPTQAPKQLAMTDSMVVLCACPRTGLGLLLLHLLR